jgi:microcystin-dependent protein
MFGGSFAPAGWAFCAGQLLPISENDVLFQLIGTTYGGDGEETFALPNLQSRLPLHQGNGFVLGEAAGTEEVTLTNAQMPVHAHTVVGSAATAGSADPTNNVAARVTVAGVFPYGTDEPKSTLSINSVSPIGGSQPHTNLQPYLCISFIISLFGIYPPPN